MALTPARWTLRGFPRILAVMPGFSDILCALEREMLAGWPWPSQLPRTDGRTPPPKGKRQPCALILPRSALTEIHTTDRTTPITELLAAATPLRLENLAFGWRDVRDPSGKISRIIQALPKADCTQAVQYAKGQGWEPRSVGSGAHALIPVGAPRLTIQNLLSLALLLALLLAPNPAEIAPPPLAGHPALALLHDRAALLPALHQALPETAYLERLAVRGGELEMTIHSSEPEAAQKSLAALSFLHDVRLKDGLEMRAPGHAVLTLYARLNERAP